MCPTIEQWTKVLHGEWKTQDKLRRLQRTTSDESDSGDTPPPTPQAQVVHGIINIISGSPNPNDQNEGHRDDIDSIDTSNFAAMVNQRCASIEQQSEQITPNSLQRIALARARATEQGHDQLISHIADGKSVLRQGGSIKMISQPPTAPDPSHNRDPDGIYVNSLQEDNAHDPLDPVITVSTNSHLYAGSGEEFQETALTQTGISCSAVQPEDITTVQLADNFPSLPPPDAELNQDFYASACSDFPELQAQVQAKMDALDPIQHARINDLKALLDHTNKVASQSTKAERKRLLRHADAIYNQINHLQQEKTKEAIKHDQELLEHIEDQQFCHMLSAGLLQAVKVQLDQGANINVVPHAKYLHNYQLIKPQALNVANKSWMMAVGVGYLALEDKNGEIRFEIGFHCPDVAWPIYSPNASIKYEHALGKTDVASTIDHYPKQETERLELGPGCGYCQLYEFEYHQDGTYDNTYEFTRRNHLQWIAPPLIMPTVKHSTVSVTAALAPRKPTGSQTLCRELDALLHPSAASSPMDPPPTLPAQTVNAIISHNQQEANTPIPDDLLQELDDDSLKITANGNLIKVETVTEDTADTDNDSTYTAYDFQDDGQQSVDDATISSDTDTIHSTPAGPQDDSDFVNHISQAAQWELMHQRLAHASHDVMRKTIPLVEGVKPCKAPDDLHHCDSCAIAKIHKLPSGPASATLPRHNCQEVMMDFGFMATLKDEEVDALTDDTSVSPSPPAPTHSRQTRAATRAAAAAQARIRATSQLKSAKTLMPPPSLNDIEPGNAEPHPDPKIRTTMIGVDFDELELSGNFEIDRLYDKLTAIEGIHGYKSYLIIVCRKSRYVWVFLSKDKEPPIHIMELWFTQHGCNGLLQSKLPPDKRISGCVVRTDLGGELAGSQDFKDVCARAGYMVETTGKDSSSQIGLAESPHRRAGEAVRALLHNASLPLKYWPYALLWWALIWNMTYHRSVDHIPYFLLTGIVPNLSRLRVFGSKVYARKPGGKRKKLKDNYNEGVFVGYTATMSNIIYIDAVTGRESRAKHVIFDESNFTRIPMPPGALRLARITGRRTPDFLMNDAKALQHSPVITVPNIYFERISITMPMKDSINHGFIFEEDKARNRMFLIGAQPNSYAVKILRQFPRLRRSWLLSIHGYHVHHKQELTDTLADLNTRDPDTDQHHTWVFSPDGTHTRHLQPTHYTLLDMDQLASIHRAVKKMQHFQRHMEITLLNRRQASDAPTDQEQATDSPPPLVPIPDVTVPPQYVPQNPDPSDHALQPPEMIPPTEPGRALSEGIDPTPDLQNPDPRDHALQIPDKATLSIEPGRADPQEPGRAECSADNDSGRDDPLSDASIVDKPATKSPPTIHQEPRSVAKPKSSRLASHASKPTIIVAPDGTARKTRPSTRPRSYQQQTATNDFLQRQTAVAQAIQETQPTHVQAASKIEPDAPPKLHIVDTINSIFGNDANLNEDELTEHLNLLFQQDPDEVEA